jgi:hypothetical protein
MMDRTADLPFFDQPTFDLCQYVTDKGLDGLFLMIAREEEKIREDPLARTTDLLKQVFGSEKKKKSFWQTLFGR